MIIIVCAIEQGLKVPEADCTWHDKRFLRGLRPPLQTKDLSCVYMMDDLIFPEKTTKNLGAGCTADVGCTLLPRECSSTEMQSGICNSCSMNEPGALESSTNDLKDSLPMIAQAVVLACKHG